MLYLIGIIITFFLAFILLSKNNKTVADNILFSWLLMIGLHLSMFYSFYIKAHLNYPFLLGLNIPFPLFHGPFLYLYTAAVTNQLNKWKVNVLHFLPIFIFYVFLIDFFMLPNKEKILVFVNEGKSYETLLDIIFICILSSGIIYVILSLLLLRKHKMNILNQFSYHEKINMSWLRYLIFGIAVSWVFVIFGNDELLFGVVVLLVIFIGYFGINQAGVFSNKTFKNRIIEFSDHIGTDISSKDNINFDQGITVKYKKSGLNKENALKIHKKLIAKIDSEKLYVNPELSLIELAELLDIHPNNLSQVINSIERKNFYDFINTKRIEHFIELVSIPENKKFTILSLAFECGFNSKSSFNKYFKKVTNQTPSEYISNN